MVSIYHNKNLYIIAYNDNWTRKFNFNYLYFFIPSKKKYLEYNKN